MGSLNARLLGSLSLLILLFFGLTIAALDSVFRNTGERAVRDVLDIHLIALLSVAEPDGRGGLVMPDDLPEARFTNPGSGLYAEILNSDGVSLWRSPSAIGNVIEFGEVLKTGERRFQNLTLNDDTPVLALSMGIEWEFDDEHVQGFAISVAESLESYHAQVDRFRRQLFGWFGLLALLLLVSQAVLLRWLVQPLKRMETAIGEIETGRRSELDGDFPGKQSPFEIQYPERFQVNQP